MAENQKFPIMFSEIFLLGISTKSLKLFMRQKEGSIYDFYKALFTMEQ
jgi:hypothetical protein